MPDNKDYWSTIDYAKHLNTIQGGIRVLASTWLLTIMGGIGFIFKPSEGDLKWFMSPFELVGSICFLGCCGLFLLWNLDQKIYQRLIGAVFLVGLRMEQQNSEIPPINLMMLKRIPKGVTFRATLLYAISMSILVCISVFSLMIHKSNTTSLDVKVHYPNYVVPSVILIEIILISYISFFAFKMSSHNQREIFGNEFKEMYSNERILNFLLNRYNSKKPGFYQQQFRIVITGGAYSGKTTMLNKLAEKLNLTAVPEAAIEVIEDLRNRMGNEEQKRWRKEYPALFQKLVAEKQFYNENTEAVIATKGIVLLDRSMLDGFAYCKFYNVHSPGELEYLSGNCEYNIVFILETISPFENRAESGRTSNEEDSRRQSKILYEIYEEYNYKPIWIPMMPLNDRIELMSNLIRKHTGH